MRHSIGYFLVVTFFTCSCTSAKRAVQTTADPVSLHLLGEYVFPYNLNFKQTTVGGLSGIDYDAANDLYYMISDDRSEKSPARFYTAKISVSEKGIDSVRLLNVVNLLTQSGNTYPGHDQYPQGTPDPEAVRYNPISNQLVWSSEGERIVRGKDTILADPAINVIRTDGKFVDAFQLPGNLHMQAIEKGPRQNGVLEGLAFANSFKTLYTSLEEPLYEDGPPADTVANRAFTRIYKFDVATRSCIAQYAYELDPVAIPARPATSFKINGIADILSIGNNKMLILERSYSTGILACTIKVFIVDLTNAMDVSRVTDLSTGTFRPVKKHLLLNMNEPGIYTDNIEGMTLGPPLRNGHKTILLVADNNFNPLEKAQLLLFEIKE